MKKKWAIKETDKKPDQSLLGKPAAWIKANSEKVLYIIVTVIALSMLTSYFILRNKKLNAKSWEEFSTLQQKITETEKPQDFEPIDNFVKKYPKSAASAYASMFKGEILYENASYEKAEKVYRQIIKNKSFEKYIPFAINSLLYCFLAQDKKLEFFETAEGFVKKYPKHLLTPQVYAQMADIYQSKGETEKVTGIYRKLSLDFPKSPWGSFAKIMLEQKTGGGEIKK